MINETKKSKVNILVIKNRKKMDKEKKEKITRNKENKRSKERTTFRKMRSLLFDCRRERGEQEGKAKDFREHYFNLSLILCLVVNVFIFIIFICY